MNVLTLCIEGMWTQDHVGPPHNHNRQDVWIAVVLVVAVSFVKVICRGSRVKRVLSDNDAI